MPESHPPAGFDAAASRRTLFDALIDARDRYGAKTLIIEDQDRRVLNYTDLIRAAFALGRRIALTTTAGERVGIMLPTSLAARIRSV